MFEQIQEQDWVMNSLGENHERLLNKHNSLRVDIRFTPDNIAIFEIYDGDILLGASSQYAPTINDFKREFIYKGVFNVFLRKQNIQHY